MSGLRFEDGVSESACTADHERGDVVNERVEGAIALQLQILRAGAARQRVDDMVVWDLQRGEARRLRRGV